MATVTNPTYKNMVYPYTTFGELPLLGDQTTAKKYLEENSLGAFSSMTTSSPVFSNDGSRVFQQYISGQTWSKGDPSYLSGKTYEWRTISGYDSIILTITHS